MHLPTVKTVKQAAAGFRLTLRPLPPLLCFTETWMRLPSGWGLLEGGASGHSLKTTSTLTLVWDVTPLTLNTAPSKIIIHA